MLCLLYSYYKRKTDHTTVIADFWWQRVQKSLRRVQTAELLQSTYIIYRAIPSYARGSSARKEVVVEVCRGTAHIDVVGTC